MHEDQDEWELSKENVQPLKHGRNVSSIAAALQTQSAEQTARIKHEKQEFEAELRIYSGDDPLDVWDRYIKWTEENFPKGGKDGSLTALLERCLMQFTSHEKYQDDPRYIDSWVKFANLCTDPIEIFSFMFDNNIGCGLAVFFDAWALALEQGGNTKKADTIYKEGISRNAQPVDYLKRNHQKFQARVARGVVGMNDHVLEDLQEENRKVLGQLKIGKRNQVAANRNALAQKSSKGGLGLRNVIPAKQVGSTFQVYSEENVGACAPTQTGEWKSMPQREKSNVENEKKPGVWTQAKVPQKHVPVVPITSVSSHNAPAFIVHVDETTEDSPVNRTPYKPPQDTTQVLSVRKKVSYNDPMANFRQNAVANAVDANQVPMYCKNLVYNGLSEFSFEEIRAAKYQAKQKKEKEEIKRKEEMEQIEAGRKALLDMKNELELQQKKFQQEILESRKQMQSEREIFEKELKEKLQKELVQSAPQPTFPPNADDQAKRKDLPSQMLQETTLQPKPECEIEKNGLCSYVSSDDMTPDSVPPQPFGNAHVIQRSHAMTSLMDGDQSNEKKVSKQLNFASELSSKGSLPPCNASNMIQPYQQSSELSKRTSTTPSDESHCMSRNSDSFTAKLKGIAAPSPTVNTKAAMQVVSKMFNSSMCVDKHFGWTDDSEMDMVTHKEPVVDKKPANPPFTIYMEPEDNCSENAKQKSSCVEVEDKENQCARFKNPEAFRKREFGEVQKGYMPMPKHDFELTDDVPDNEDKMEGIESQQLFSEDFTIAPIGSQASFAASAKMSSTPFIPTKLPDPSAVSTLTSNNEIEDIDMSPQKSTQLNSHSSSGKTKDSTNVLSPIIEGSSDESSKGSNGHIGITQLDGGSCTFPLPDKTSPHHEIDISCYHPPELDEETVTLVNSSICINPSNPFDEDTINQILDSLDEPLDLRENFKKVMEPIRGFDSSSVPVYSLGCNLYDISGKIAEGGFASIYKLSPFSMGLADDDDDDGAVDSVVALKLQKPACPWEFYITDELKTRLRKLQAAVDVSPSIVSFIDFRLYTDGSGGAMQYLPDGSLLDFCNQMKLKPCIDREPIAVYLAVELIHIVEKMHKCHIIHGDMKPDNFLMLDMPTFIKDNINPFGSKTRCVRLIDFGRSIDMTKFKKGTTFMAKVKTSGFQCIEMQTNRPWTYQTDLFGLIGSIHVILFGQYMKVYQSQGSWQITSNFVRKWNVPLWKKLFYQLLNVKGCFDLPDLESLRVELQKYFISNLIPGFNKSMMELKSR